MRKCTSVLMIVLTTILVILSGCVTYKDGEPVKDEAYEKRQEEKKAKEQKNEKEEKVKKDTNDKETEKELSIKDKIIKEHKLAEEIEIDDGYLGVKIDSDGSFSVNTLVSHNALEAFEIMDTAFKDDSVDVVSVTVMVTMVDVKGNENKDDAVNIFYRKDNFEDFDVDNFLKLARAEPWRIYNQANSYHIHPGIYNDLKSSIKDNLEFDSHKAEVPS